jgi:signal peptidase I
MGERLVIGPAPKRRLPIRGVVKWLIALVILGLIAVRLLLVELVQVRGNTMAPNVLEGDVLLVVRRATPQPGDVVLVQHGGRAVLRRVLAMPGDTVGTAEGVVLRNELPLETRTAGTFAYYEHHAGDAERPRRQQLFVERFDDGRRHAALGDHIGAAHPWSIELPALEVPSGHLFVLCDNRRTCPLDELAGVVPRAWVRGVVRYLMWYGDARVEPADGRPPWGAFLRLDSQRPASGE